MNEEINLIIHRHFNESPKDEDILRMKAGICNEVYRVGLASKSVIVRMNETEIFFEGSSKNIPLFKSKGIKVPEILYQDYSKKLVPYAYQVLTYIEGDDLGQVIQNLNPQELKAIAKQVSGILLNLSDLPTNGKFGWTPGVSSKFVNSWSDVMLESYYKVEDRNDKTGVVGKELVALFSSLISKNTEYFDSVPSKFVFDDISSKNIIIKDGKFNGVVDLDQVMYGDFLEPVGRIMASWYGTEYGKIYLDAMVEYLSLNQIQREMVAVYAVLSRIYWLSEAGIVFNKNTTSEINQEKAREGKRVIELLRREL